MVEIKPIPRCRMRGAVAIEFAITLPLLCLFLSGVINLGSMLWQLQQFSDAARHGARIAANRSNDLVAPTCLNLCAMAIARSTDYINLNSLDPSGFWDDPSSCIVSASSSGPTTFTGDYIKVRIKTPGPQNCVFCYGNLLNYISISLESLFLIEGRCTGATTGGACTCL